MILQKAGPSYLDILKFIVDDFDVDDFTPIYFLCRRGYDEEEKNKTEEEMVVIQDKRNQNRAAMIQMLCPQGKLKDESTPNIFYMPAQTKNNLMHWLAYWDDHYSINYLLKTIDEEGSADPLKALEWIIQPNFEGLGSLDIAGKKNNFLSANMLIDYCTKKDQLLKQIFKSKNDSSNQIAVAASNKSELEKTMNSSVDQGPFNLKFVRYHQCTKQ